MTYHRVWAVTPLVGAGKPGDPKRPMFVPATPVLAADGSGVLGFRMDVSDDGRFALVELVFQSPAAFQDALAKEAASRGISEAAGTPAANALEAAVPGLKLFECGKTTQQEVETEFRKYKNNYQFNPFTVVVQ